LAAKAAADQAAADAIEARDKAKEAARQTQAMTARTGLALGNYLAETGDPFAALAWYARAWAEDRGAGVPEATHRTRFGGILGQPRAVLRACFFPPAPVLDVRWTPTGHWVITRTDDHRVFIWDVENPAADPIRVAPAGPLTHVELSPDGRTLATCGTDG